MGIKITVNIALECLDEDSAQEILLHAMHHKLLNYLIPIPGHLVSGYEVADWRYKNWGDVRELEYNSGWILKNKLFLELYGDNPNKLYGLLLECDKINAVTLNYTGDDGIVKPVICGIYVNREHIGLK